MGVSGLWELLAPVGRTVRVETLNGKILAIDASIWIAQFLNAMKDDDGKVTKNSHLLGTTRRVLKLLYHGVLPVFVFDGSVPLLKVRTVRARRLLRLRHDMTLRRAAEKIFLNKLRVNTHLRGNPYARAPVAPAPDTAAASANNFSPACQSGTDESTGGIQRRNHENSDEEWEDGFVMLSEKPLEDESDLSEGEGEGLKWALPQGGQHMAVDVLAALPQPLRKTLIEEARKKEGRRKRKDYLPVAENPLLYSQTQIASFLRSSQLNQVIEKSQQLSVVREADIIASCEGFAVSTDGSHCRAAAGASLLPSAKGDGDENPPAHHDWVQEGKYCSGGGGFLEDVSHKVPRVSSCSSEWMCVNCTLYHGADEQVCLLCGLPRVRNDITSTTPAKCQTEPITREGKQPIVGCDEQYLSDTDSWEENDYSVSVEQQAGACVDLESSVPRHTVADDDDILSARRSQDNSGDSDAIAPNPPRGTLLKDCSEDLVNRAVISARNMGDWASRAVQRALKGKEITTGTDFLALTTDELNITPPNSYSADVSDESFASFDLGEETKSSKCDRPTAENRTIPVSGDGENQNSELVEDIKQLLDAFNIPYITAPFEAEAQCAYMEKMGLVHGIVTEDSDAFLFGAKCVYKNIFSEKKYVEAYLAADVERDLGLDRIDLIVLAYLLGSDYTDGVKGVGIVNAMEILDVFGEDNDEGNAGADHDSNLGSCDKTDLHSARTAVTSLLEKFRNWLEADHIMATTSEKLLNTREKGRCVEVAQRKDSAEVSLRMLDFGRKHPSARHKWTVDGTFPDKKVAEAYLRPEVNTSVDKFAWDKPMLFKVKKYCQEVLGWTEDEVSSQVTPVIKKCLAADTEQTRIDSYYVTYHENSRVATIQSSRLKLAVERLRQRSNRVSYY